MNIIFDIFKQSDIIPKIILDVGTYDCKDSIKFSKYWPNAKIYAFEPSPEAIKIAKENIKTYSNIELIECAISNVDGYVNWYQSTMPGETGSSSSIKKPVDHLILHPTIKFNKTKNVKSMKLDTWIKEKNIDIIDLIWADVNGAEDLFLQGSIETLKRTRLLWTEYFNFELFQGQLPLHLIQKELPDFELVQVIGNNALFLNKIPLPE